MIMKLKAEARAQGRCGATEKKVIDHGREHWLMRRGSTEAGYVKMEKWVMKRINNKGF
jgi:hypothetical protein